MVVAAVVERARDEVARPKSESRWIEKVLLKPYGLIYGFVALSLTPSLPQYPIRRPKANLKARMGLWKSYAQQEAEATGREAKVRWARKEGVSVQSIQHDCVVVGRVGPEAADAYEGAALAEAMSSVVTAAVGYDVRVKAKWCEEVGAIVWAD